MATDDLFPEIPEIDTTVAHSARIYDYLLGGTDNFAVDRDAIERGSVPHPGGVETARTNARAQRAFLGRAVRYLVGKAGLSQFLDIGTGIPSGDNVHAVAQQVTPEARIVYVDNDPVVLAHAHALLKGTPPGATAYLHGDLCDPEDVLQKAAATLDFDRPVAVMLVGILHVIRDEYDPYGIVATLREAVPSGSHLVVSHLAADIRDQEMAEVFGLLNQTMREPFVLRSRTEVTRFLDGLGLVDPGVVTLDQWRPGERSGETATPASDVIPAYGAVGRKS